MSLYGLQCQARRFGKQMSCPCRKSNPVLVVVLYLTFRIADRRTDTPLALFDTDNKSCKKKAPSYSQATAAAAPAATAGIYTPLPVPTVPLTSGFISVALSFVNWKDTHNVNRLLQMRIGRWLV